MDTYVLSFRSTHDAFKTMHLLHQLNVTFTVIPTPIEISANCGISIYLEVASIESIKEILHVINNIIYVKAEKTASQVVLQDIED